MNIIQHLQQDKNYINQALQGLQLHFESIHIDCSKGETDSTSILYIQKNDFSFNEALAILTIKQKMLKEEWNNIEAYNKEDVKFWMTLIEKEYEDSTYYENVTHDEFLNDYFIHRLQFDAGINSIYKNDIQISYKKFKEITPCNDVFVKIAKSSFKRLEAEYYLETDNTLFCLIGTRQHNFVF
jgi:hypothetical protein